MGEYYLYRVTKEDTRSLDCGRYTLKPQADSDTKLPRSMP